MSALQSDLNPGWPVDVTQLQGHGVLQPNPDLGILLSSLHASEQAIICLQNINSDQEFSLCTESTNPFHAPFD